MIHFVSEVVMEKIIIYCHGYGSSAKTDKVGRLAQAGMTLAWNIDIDPNISLDTISENVVSVLLDKINKDLKLIFVGTSLGAWYASKLSDMFGGTAVLINPAIDPKNSLSKYNVPEEIRNNYVESIEFKLHDKVFIGTQDEVFDFSNVDFGDAEVEYVDADHRFSGEEFDKVIDYIKKL